MKRGPTKCTTIRDDLHFRLRKLSDRLDVSATLLLDEAVENYLDMFECMSTSQINQKRIGIQHDRTMRAIDRSRLAGRYRMAPPKDKL